MKYMIILVIVSLSYSGCDQIYRDILPIKYDLTLTPFFETENDSHFSSNLVFTFKPLTHRTTTTIVLHADNLFIHSFLIFEENNGTVKKLDAVFDFDKDKQLLHFDTGYPFSVDNNYELYVNYSGIITDDGWGLYKGSYKHYGETRYYTVTQLRPIFARRLLPCLDEPLYKARFIVRIWRLPKYTARSNMPLIDTSPRSLITGRVLDTFSESPPMSAFLLAIAVFDFAFLDSADRMFFSWAIPSKIHLAEHGHRMLPALVKAMESVVGAHFPLPKLDQIALPQLNPVAMENWGMNTYREVFMLYKEGWFDPRVRQDVPRFTSHEIAHHWLGNLVTLRWWDWLWLSEMYAMYYEYYLPSQVEPSWRMADQMVVDLVIPGLLQDSFDVSKPLSTHVSTNQEILDKFSGVTYTKGPALVRMIDNFMTRSRAEDALKSLIYLKKYGTINPSELWQIYDRHADNLPAAMETIMSSWTEQPGYPLITVTVNQPEGVFFITQERFLMESLGGGSDSGKWWVPLTFTTGVRPNFTSPARLFWLSPHSPRTAVRVGRSIDSWVLFNIQLTGFYRVNYDLSNWEKLIDVLLSNPGAIHDLNRAQLLDDSFALARSGRLPYSIPLRLASYLGRDNCYFPWRAVLPSFNFLLTRLKGHSVYNNFKEYLRQVIAPVYKSIGFKLNRSNSHLQEMHRVQIVTMACSIGLPACLEDAKYIEEFIIQGNLTVTPAGLDFVQLCAVLEAGMSHHDIFPHLSTWDPQDQLRSMPCIANKNVLTGFLNKSLHEDSAANWKAKLIAAISRVGNIESVFMLLIEKFQTLLIRFGGKNVADYVSEIGTFLTTKTELILLMDLKTTSTDDDVSKALSAIYNDLEERIHWIENFTPNIDSWLHTNENGYQPNDISDSFIYC